MLDFLHTDKDPATGKVMRRVRSFVLREGRLTAGQQRALEELWPRYGLEATAGVLDPRETFGRDAPLVLEIGYGMGESLIQMARAEPDKNFVGIEVHRPGVGALLLGIEHCGCENLRTWCDDAVPVLEQCIPEASLHRLQLYFPDPWPKKKHHKRRIVQPEFVERVRTRMEPGGVFHMATDWEDYAQHMLEVMEQAPGWKNLAGPGQFAPRPSWRPQTKFERRGEGKGHGVWDLLYSPDEAGE